MTTTHTPGPWCIVAAPNGHRYILAEHRAEIARMGSENQLADDSSAAANAQLIASAPLMVMALEAAEAALLLASHTEDHRARAPILKVLGVVRNAITTAKGEHHEPA